MTDLEQPSDNEPRTPDTPDKASTTSTVIAVEGEEPNRFQRMVVRTFSEISRELLVPALKSALADAIRFATDSFIYGSMTDEYDDYGRRTRRTRRHRPHNTRNYSSRYGYNTHGHGTMRTHVPQPSRDGRAVMFTTRADASDTLAQLNDIVYNYGQVSVSHFYRLVGLSNDIADKDWGWTSLAGVSVRSTRTQYYIDFTDVEYIG